jgi:hypothetical protein
MVYPRCPRLDVLANRLIEIYRTEDAFSVTSSGGYSPMEEIHIAIRDHKKECVLCQKIMGQKIMETQVSIAVTNALTT